MAEGRPDIPEPAGRSSRAAARLRILAAVVVGYLALWAAGEAVRATLGREAIPALLVVAALGLLALAGLRPDLIGRFLGSPLLADLPESARAQPRRLAVIVALAILMIGLFGTGALMRGIRQGAAAVAELVRLWVAPAPGPAAPGYQLVFDAAQKPPDLWFPANGLVFVPFCLLIWYAHHSGLVRLRGGPAFAVTMLVFALGWTGIAAAAIMSQYLGVQAALREGRAAVVEGEVRDFHPMPPAGHDSERFTVGGVRYAYSDYSITPGFNRTSSHGGPLRAGLQVRVHYVGPPGQPTIVRLEVRSP